MAQFEPQGKELDALGANLIYIAAEKRTGLWKPAEYLARHPVSFPFLLDEDRSVTKAYGLYHGWGHDAFRIAYPATLIVDGNALVRRIYRGDRQTDRMPVEEVLSALRQLSSP
jgi:peroxiredoxin